MLGPAEKVNIFLAFALVFVLPSKARGLPTLPLNPSALPKFLTFEVGRNPSALPKVLTFEVGRNVTVGLIRSLVMLCGNGRTTFLSIENMSYSEESIKV